MGFSKKPIDYFTTGWLAGAASAIFNTPLGEYDSRQTKCLSMEGCNESEYGVKRAKAQKFATLFLKSNLFRNHVLQRHPGSDFIKEFRRKTHSD